MTEIAIMAVKSELNNILENIVESKHLTFDCVFSHNRYRKALRMMKYADHHGFPIITFIDTPGAFADVKSEELGQVC